MTGSDTANKERKGRLGRLIERSVLLASLIVAAMIGLTVAIDASRDMGGNIPTLFLERDYLIALIWGALLTLSFFVWPVTAAERAVLLSLWTLRLVVTLVMMLAYEHQYDFLDSYTYFADSREIAQSDYKPRAAFGTRNVIYAFSYVWYLLPPSFHALKVSCAYVGLIASFIFFRAWRLAAGGASTLPLWAIGTMPSILFWSSSLGKEPLIFVGLAVSTWAVLKFWRDVSFSSLIALAIGLVAIFFVRPWMAIIFGAAVAIAFVLRPSRPFIRVVALAFAGAVVATLLIYASDIVELVGQEGLYETLETVSSEWAVGGSAQEPVSFASLSDVVVFFPIGAFAALFRPLPGEIGGAFGLLAGTENLVILALCVWAIVRLRSTQLTFPLAFAIALILCWTSIYAFLSYQNLGTAVRFKLQVLPFLMALIGFAIQVVRRDGAEVMTSARGS